jgi:hypothetical protein
MKSKTNCYDEDRAGGFGEEVQLHITFTQQEIDHIKTLVEKDLDTHGTLNHIISEWELKNL